METVADSIASLFPWSSDRPFIYLAGGDDVEMDAITEMAQSLRRQLAQSGLMARDLVMLEFPANSWPLFASAYLGTHLGRMTPVIVGAWGSSQGREASRELPVRAVVRPSGPDDFAVTFPGIPPTPAPENIAEYLFTSGTTGQPKAVPVPHSARLARRRERRDGATGAIAIAIPPGSNAAQTVLFEALLNGSSLACLERWSPADFVGLAERSRATAALLPPAMAASLVRNPAFDPGCLHRLRSLRLGMAPATRELIESLAGALPWVAITNIYTTTEAWPAATVMRYGRDDSGSVGQPLPGTRLRVVDDLTGEPVANATAGRVQLAYARGGARHVRWTETGDIGYLNADGSLVVLGRRDDIVTRGGLVISLAEVEKAILGSGLVLDAAAYRISNPHGGEQVGAAVVWRGSAEERALRQRVREFLGQDATPTMIVGVLDVPRDPQGKLRRDLLEPAVPPTLTGDDPVIDQLRGIWAEIFMRRNFDPSDDFFEIGGDSLAVAICNALIEEELGILLPISLHYEATTLGELAEAVQVRISAPPANDSTRPAQP